MVSYYKPWYYTASHVGIGFAAVWYPLVGILAILYQVGQLLFNVRVFPVEGKILQGNSIQHTIKKLSEIGLGYGIGYLMKNMA
jgi:hypothetical protein